MRIEGAVVKSPAEESDAIFHARPLGSRISAIASPQSEVVASRDVLEARVERTVRQHRQDHREVERPDGWGAYRVLPDHIEFWQSGANRLHDRMHYRRDGDTWVLERLAP